MASSAKTMVRLSEDSSSSDDEELKRCQEAVWETRTNKKEEDSKVKQSKRFVVADHEHDGNELQVTQGFRTHVAKKLGHLLDSCITEKQPEAPSCMESVACDDDEGFRLFSTSVPGQKAEDPPAPVKRRPVSSSSDSDSEMEIRLREAAVSVRDLLPSSAQPSTPTPPSTELPCSKTKTAAEQGESSVVKKKRRRKQNQPEDEQVDSAGSALNTQSNSEQENSELRHTQVKIKRKKKKKGNAEN